MGAGIWGHFSGRQPLKNWDNFSGVGPLEIGKMEGNATWMVEAFI